LSVIILMDAGKILFLTEGRVDITKEDFLTRSGVIRG